MGKLGLDLFCFPLSSPLTFPKEKKNRFECHICLFGLVVKVWVDREGRPKRHKKGANWVAT